MGDIENFNEQIDDLKDRIHDLELDVKTLEKENDQLQKEMDEAERERTKIDEIHDRMVKALETGEDEKSQELQTYKRDFQLLELKYEECYHSFIKSLSIAETVKMNGNTDYFKTDDGRILLDWALNELKKAAKDIFT